MSLDVTYLQRLYNDDLESKMKKLWDQFNTVFYVQVWTNRIKVTNTSSGAVFDEKPLVATSTDNKNKITIEAVGNDASLVAGNKVEVINPFNHVRTPISSFKIAKMLLLFIFGKLSEGAIFRPKPKVVIQLMENIKGGLTDIEEQAFKELALGAGARSVYLYTGTKELSLADFNYEYICQIEIV